MVKFFGKLLKFLSGRVFWAAVLIIFQLIIIALGIWFLSDNFFLFYAFFFVLTIVVVIWLVSKRDNPSYKLAWLIPIMMFPLFGGLFYLLFGNKKIPRKLKSGLTIINADAEPYMRSDEAVLDALHREDPDAAGQARYLSDYAMSPTYRHTRLDFQTPGEVNFEYFIKELEGAKRYIFLEYFIVQHGYMLDTILDLLERKAKEGVDVRILYDDVGSLFTVDGSFIKEVRARGIKIARFNPLRPALSVFMNNRDHRKITVIDGITAFTGGVNLADEYINRKERFGHWKDSALMVKGEAVWSFLVMFLETWNLVHNIEHEDFEPYRATPEDLAANAEDDGYITPYGDSPLDYETVGENVYRNMISVANDYVYIMTPYFIVDNEMVTTLTLAAKKGVDVRIMVPHIPDKFFVFMLTQAYYPQLVNAGVRVYEYTPGFVHTKACICDDIMGATGTVNFDYRSFYLHFECGVLMYDSRAISQIRDDFLGTLPQCEEITSEFIESISTPKRLFQAILRVFAPLL